MIPWNSPTFHAHHFQTQHVNHPGRDSSSRPIYSAQTSFWAFHSKNEKFKCFFFPKQFTVGVLSSFLRGVRPCVTGRVRLSGSVVLFVSLHLSPFMCPSGWWCPALWVSRFIYFLSFVSLLVSGSLGLSLYLSPFSCLPSCVLLGGGVRLSGSLALFVSLHLSPFMCPSGWWCPAFSVARFICLSSFVSLNVAFWVVVFDSLGFLALFVSLHLSPFMCPSRWWCPALWVSRFICLPSFVSLHVSFWVVVSGFLGFSLYLSPFMCPSGWWCPAL